jgi:hypothetical protein
MVPVHLGGKWLIVQVILLGGARQRLSGTGDLFRFRNFAAFGGAIRILEEPRFWPIFRRSMLRISIVGKNRRCVFAERLPLYLFEMLRYAASFAILLSAFSGIGRGQQHAVDPTQGFHRLVCLVHLTGSGNVHFVAADRKAFQSIFADTRPEIRVFEIGVATQAQIEAEMGMYKAGFSLENLKVVAR